MHVDNFHVAAVGTLYIHWISFSLQWKWVFKKWIFCVDSLSDAKWPLKKFCGQMNKNECLTKNLKKSLKSFKIIFLNS